MTRGFGGLILLSGILAAHLVVAAPLANPKLRMVDGRPLVEGVYVNGHGPYSFLLDTGTTANHLELKLAQAIGLRPTFRSELISATGTVYAPGADGIDVTVDSVHAKGQRFLFAGTDVLRELAPDIK